MTDVEIHNLGDVTPPDEAFGNALHITISDLINGHLIWVDGKPYQSAATKPELIRAVLTLLQQVVVELPKLDLALNTAPQATTPPLVPVTDEAFAATVDKELNTTPN